MNHFFFYSFPSDDEIGTRDIQYSYFSRGLVYWQVYLLCNSELIPASHLGSVEPLLDEG